MARHKSAMKAHRQSLKRRDHNRTVKGACRTAVKKLRAQLSALPGDAEQARKAVEPMFQQVQKVLMKAGQKRIIHPRAAARTISRLGSAVHQALTASK